MRIRKHPKLDKMRMLSFRVNEEEYFIIIEKARRQGLSTSGWARYVLLNCNLKLVIEHD